MTGLYNRIGTYIYLRYRYQRGKGKRCTLESIRIPRVPVPVPTGKVKGKKVPIVYSKLIFKISVWYLKNPLNARYFKMTCFGTRKYASFPKNLKYCYQKIKISKNPFCKTVSDTYVKFNYKISNFYVKN